MERRCLILLLCFGVLQLVNSSTLPRVQVDIDQGILQGTTLTTEYGFDFDVFYEIPYAEPPVGPLRFKAPEKAGGWEGIRDASRPGKVCVQMPLPGLIFGDEDCLYLDVYVPHDSSINDAPLSVMVYVHGGGYYAGAANMYDPRYFVERDVVLVVPNYRLAIMGFLALGNSEVPGNAGLKDIVLALEWVQENIHNFGGDPTNVAVFGESAGATLTNFLLVSPMTTGLFNKAILQSGMATVEWALQDYPERAVVGLCELLTIDPDNIDYLHEILLQLPADSVVWIGALFVLQYQRLIPFIPIVEGEYSSNPFLTENPKRLMEAGNYSKIPIIAGITNLEGTAFLDFDPNHVSTIADVVPDFAYYIPKDIRNSLTPQEQEDVKNSVRDFYFPNTDNLVDNYIDLNSDFQYMKDVDKYTRALAKHLPENVYFYQFSYDGAWNYMRQYVNYNYTGAAHGDDLGYMFFYEAFLSVPSTDVDHLVRRRLIDFWTNFAKYGDPNMNSSVHRVHWMPSTEDEIRCLNMDEDLTIITEPYLERMRFWRDLENRYLSKSV